MPTRTHIGTLPFGPSVPLGVVLLAVVSALPGCAGGTPDVATLEVARRGWDTLAVTIRFEERDWLGRRSPVRPGSVAVAVFDAAYDTLYVGPDEIIAVPDGRLGDAEPILVEACGSFRAGPVCEQQTVFSSPKRFWSGLEVTFPTDEALERGSYSTRPTVERRVFDGEAWEVLPHAAMPPLSARVRVAGSGVDGIRLPLRTPAGSFDLASDAGYRDFRYHLRSAFRDSGRAEVVFQAFAGTDGHESPAGSVRVPLVDRSEEELLLQLEPLVRAAVRDLVERLQGFFGAERTYVFVNAWSYDALERAFEAEVELHLRDGAWLEIAGVLRVTEDGRQAWFRRDRANGPAALRWEERIGPDSLSLRAGPPPTRADRPQTRAWD